MSDAPTILRATVRLVFDYMGEGSQSAGTGFGWIGVNDGVPQAFLVTAAHLAVEPHSLTISGRAKSVRPAGTAQATDVRVSNPQWLIHPSYRYAGRAAQLDDPDLAILPLQRHPEIIHALDFELITLDALPSDVEIASLSVLEEVVMCGCPLALWDDHNATALFQRGITATDPKSDYRGQPQGLLDIFALEGSSGSPVAVLRARSVTVAPSLHPGVPPPALTVRRLVLLGVQVGIPVGIPRTLTTSSGEEAIYEFGTHLALYVKAQELLRVAALGVPAGVVLAAAMGDRP